MLPILRHHPDADGLTVGEIGELRVEEYQHTMSFGDFRIAQSAEAEQQVAASDALKVKRYRSKVEA
ncbi:hypothetical protein AU476_18210 [Cupriavidus sp. UYMSc13B]|nr:hypothetical protein AU476_18210 [Cupriavidus sp. UYMSc13B]